MSISQKNTGNIFCGKAAGNELVSYLEEQSPSTIFVLTDSNTSKHCLPYFTRHFLPGAEFRLLEMQPGEEAKNIETCVRLWKQLSDLGADRNSLLINLGGGVVSDLGGFVASTFRRGISFINIPTSLLAMVDASVGGKTGIDLGALKNQVGVIREADRVLIDVAFLKTLPVAHFVSGKAEMLKHGLIASEDYWEKVIDLAPGDERIEDLVWGSVLIKAKIVAGDPTEKGMRKVLNYGHTLGHAIESYSLMENDVKPLLHGEAIAIGMILATFLSNKKLGFPEDRLQHIAETLMGIYPRRRFNKSEIEEIIRLTVYDKKNRSGKTLFVLLEDYAAPKININLNKELLYSAFEFYHEL